VVGLVAPPLALAPDRPRQRAAARRERFVAAVVAPLQLSVPTGAVQLAVPLQSPVVCGLHVEHNLRVVPRRENIRKGNLLLDNLAVPVGVSCRGYEGGI
jgi:hypothetical protein